MQELNVPEGKNFFFAGHWQKPVTLADLAGLTGLIVDELGIKNKADWKSAEEDL